MPSFLLPSSRARARGRPVRSAAADHTHSVAGLNDSARANHGKELMNDTTYESITVLNKLMGRGFISPLVHGLLDYPLAAVLIVLPLVLDFDNGAAKWIAVAFGVGAAVLAVGTAWPTGIVKIIPPLLHGYADIVVTVALIVLPFIVGFTDDTTALVFYLVVGAGGLAATLATRFEPRMPAERAMKLGMAA
jgi:hypothetical protein